MIEKKIVIGGMERTGDGEDNSEDHIIEQAYQLC